MAFPIAKRVREELSAYILIFLKQWAYVYGTSYFETIAILMKSAEVHDYRSIWDHTEVIVLETGNMAYRNKEQVGDILFQE
ncbi:unnamed protein product [Allacma fusca]|uniref:Uncharacterized protein n=1 Tax=Allacma fusca TaxID=39272 RepID=A0A8J2PC12_9HEXA|nr:unnamed protein product [Allacma fusca]